MPQNSNNGSNLSQGAIDDSNSKSTKEVFEDHLKKRKTGEVEKDIQENFDPEVVLLTGTGTYVGHEGVRRSSQELKEYLGNAEFTYQNTLVKEQFAFLEWTASSKQKEVHDGADSFYIRDGKIVFQSIHYTTVKNK